MARLECERCGISTTRKWDWLWYPYRAESAKGKRASRALWLCPDCAGEFSSDAARDAYLKKIQKQGRRE